MKTIIKVKKARNTGQFELKKKHLNTIKNICLLFGQISRKYIKNNERKWEVEILYLLNKSSV